LIGQIIGNIYQISEKLGEGGMGSVYKGVDLNLQRPVAIKVLRADFTNNPALVERFRSEAITLAKLNHPNIATLFSFIPQDGQFFMIMEYVAGETLENIIRRRGAIPYQEAIMLFSQALEGIGQAHRIGIIHRDIKPANLMVMEEDFEEKKVKVMDFGIARILGTNHLTRPGGMVGTLHYMSPEQARALETDNRSDIYSLGIVLYEMLTGKIPFDANSEYDLIDLHIKQTPISPRTLNPTIPQEIENAVLKAMAKQPSERFQTVTDFRTFLLNQIGISVSSKIQSSPLIKETRIESGVNNPPSIPVTKVETNPNLGVIPGTRVETNPGIRGNIPATNPEIQAIIPNNNLQNIANNQSQTPIPPTIPVPIQVEPVPSQDSFLKQHGVKLFAGVLILLVIVSGVSVAFLINKNSDTNPSTPTPSVTPSISPTPESILKYGPVTKDELLKIIKAIPPTSQQQLLKEVVKFKVDFEMTETVEKEFVTVGATQELIASIRGSYLATAKPSPSPKIEFVDPTPNPIETPDISTGAFPGGNNTGNTAGNDNSKPTPPIKRPPILRPTPKPIETKPTPKPLDPIEKQNRRAMLETKRKALMFKTINTTDLEERKKIEQEVRAIEQELNKLK